MFIYLGEPHLMDTSYNEHLLMEPGETVLVSFVSPRPSMLNIEDRGETKLTVSRKASHYVFCHNSQLKNREKSQ